MLEQLQRRRRHDRRDRVLVDELRMTVPAQQDAEIVEPGDHALQLNAVHQEHGDRHLVLADAVEERVLQVVRPVLRHVACLPLVFFGPPSPPRRVVQRPFV